MQPDDFRRAEGQIFVEPADASPTALPGFSWLAIIALVVAGAVLIYLGITEWIPAFIVQVAG